MTLNVGMSPKSMGLIYMADTKDVVKQDRMSERWGVAEQTTGNVYGSTFMVTSSNSRQFFTVPLKYQGGLLVMGVSPEIGNATRSPTSVQSLKTFIEYESRNQKGKTYVGEVPEEIDWFFVKDIEVYIRGTDTIPLADNAEISVKNYYSITQRYWRGIQVPSTYGFKMTGTVDDNINYGMYVARDGTALPLQAGTREEHFSESNRRLTYPVSIYGNHSFTTYDSYAWGPSLIMGLLDNTHPKDYSRNIGRTVSLFQYPDVTNDDGIFSTSSKTIASSYYTGNKPIEFTIDTQYGNTKFFNSPKMSNINPTTLTRDEIDINKTSYNTLIEYTGGYGIGDFKASHGVNRFYHTSVWDNVLQFQTPMLFYLPTFNTPLSIFNNAYPDFSAVTPINIGKQFEDVDLGLYQFMIDNSAYSQLMNLVRSLISESLDPTNAVPGQFVTKLVLTGSDIVMMVIGKQAMLSDLDKTYNDTLKVADLTLKGILTDQHERWTISLPQTQTIEINGEFKKNKGQPFIKVPINRLFKSVGEFYDYVDSLNITSFQNVNVTPYIDSEYNQVWEKWGKQLFKRGRSEYSNSSLASFKRPNDTSLTYK